MKKLRVVVLMHADLVPPNSKVGTTADEREAWRTEFDVVQALRQLGHEVVKLGIRDEIAPIRQVIDEWQPDVAFNLLEEFDGKAVFDQHVVAYLELQRLPYTGCNPRGLMIARDKALSKSILAYHRAPVPGFFVAPRGRAVRRPKRLEFPLIVKSLVEEASYGIAQASVVDNDERMIERIKFVHERIQTDAIVERYIDGREIYVSVLGTRRLQVLPPREMVFEKLPANAVAIATHKAKWDRGYQDRHGIWSVPAELDEATRHKLNRLSRRVYRRLGLSGYARLDYRLNPAGQPYLLEANPNPQIADGEDFAESAREAGMEYRDLIGRILSVGRTQSL